MLVLTKEQRSQVIASGQEPVHMVDPETEPDYVLLHAEVYERLRSLIDDGLSMEEVGPLVERTMREEDEGDPLLESYQKYRKP